MWDHYARLAAQYYVASRFTAQAGYVPLCGNLAHHAIELQLKCGLIKAGAVPDSPTESHDRFLQREYGHSLRKAWRNFKPCHSTEDLTIFDPLIKSLDRWEEIRYPRRGIAMSVEMIAAQVPAAPASGPAMKGVSFYRMNFEQVDGFMQRMWTLMSINPALFKMTIGAERLQLIASVYEDDNVHLIYS